MSSPQQSAESEARWRKLLTQGHRGLRFTHLLFRYMPSPPRCKVCHNPFGGWGGKFAGLFGFKASRKNPNLCTRCCDALPPGGAEVDVAVLFADVRGSTQLGERLSPDAFATLLNRFYRTATEVLIRRDAIVDKLIGDAVMALFLPGVCGPAYKRRAAESALALLHAVGYGMPGDAAPWMPIGAAVNSGLAYVGNVGGEGVVDFTALGDTVNTAARMASSAAAGEVLVNEAVYAEVAGDFPGVEQRSLVVRGKQAALTVRTLATHGAEPRRTEP
ncbi:MAG TPA: adenylate/guanylate cyclase domain-containing protein [Terriglobales bacterium]|nr:adenylate/guanylate cyclase domain-containing protein [Terriglobales bacterium]